MNDSSPQAIGRIVFAVATAPERNGIERITPTPSILQTGVGPLEVDRVIAQLTSARATALISAGTCGGLSPDLRPGALVVPSIVACLGAPGLSVTAGWHARVAGALRDEFVVVTGTLVTTHRVLQTGADKQRVYRDTGAIAVDMESADLAAAAARLCIPFLALRVVIDAQTETIPAGIAAGVDRLGNVNPPALLRSVAMRPAELPALIRLAFRLGSANRLLGRAAALTRGVSPDP